MPFAAALKMLIPVIALVFLSFEHVQGSLRSTSNDKNTNLADHMFSMEDRIEASKSDPRVQGKKSMLLRWKTDEPNMKSYQFIMFDPKSGSETLTKEEFESAFNADDEEDAEEIPGDWNFLDDVFESKKKSTSQPRKEVEEASQSSEEHTQIEKEPTETSQSLPPTEDGTETEITPSLAEEPEVTTIKPKGIEELIEATEAVPLYNETVATEKEIENEEEIEEEEEDVEKPHYVIQYTDADENSEQYAVYYDEDGSNENEATFFFYAMPKNLRFHPMHDNRGYSYTRSPRPRIAWL